MDAETFLNGDDAAFRREAAIEDRILALARANWTRLCKLDPSDQILTAIEIGLRDRLG